MTKLQPPAKTFRADALLLVTAMTWGFAFVAQRKGMEFVGPFTFNAIRFLLGGASLIPLWYYQKRKDRQNARIKAVDKKFLIKGGLLAGAAIFLGSSFQQIGLVYTTAGKAGFITGLYVIIVPIIGLFWKQKTGTGIWLGALLAVVGLYFLSIHENFSIALGDLLVLVCAFFFAVHVLVVGWLTRKLPSIPLAIGQFLVCSLLSFIAALWVEEFIWKDILDAAIPILYGGLCSVGIAYTLQVVAQKNAPSSHAAVILSLESVFAVLGGWMLLSETLSARGLLGCGLMLTGMIFSQIQTHFVGKDFFKTRLLRKKMFKNHKP
ncbi:MAG: DMT family transporter [Bacteroidales bacterium]|nr:DMT family transporter [Bacteroidales bacterium]